MNQYEGKKLFTIVQSKGVCQKRPGRRFKGQMEENMLTFATLRRNARIPKQRGTSSPVKKGVRVC